MVLTKVTLFDVFPSTVMYWVLFMFSAVSVIWYPFTVGYIVYFILMNYFILGYFLRER